ncbi:PAS domain S-box protein [Flavobacterium gilvum]|uniref:histidine kinase n=1 Tax=Flavobacterium gilvum TaxID=1492737 RepID=A0AAC9I3N6_9FLAO|nr:PAS domain S-box protein [Flavobacterium gilvum]AOW09030.1 hypothetical protein EM308_05635 [Flavobacterium gilvum]KFC60575.1 histidine kinase [Flavobacterium gilvum]
MGENIKQYGITNYLNSTTKIVCGSAILYFLFAELTKLIFISQLNLWPFFPAIGLATAFTIIFGRKAIIGVAIGSLFFSFHVRNQEILHATNHQDFTNALSICLIIPITCLINVYLVSHYTQLWCKTKYPFIKGKYILNFSIASLLGSIIATLTGIALIAIFSNLSTQKLHLIWSNLFRGNLLGIILITPFVLSWLYKEENKTQWDIQKKIEAFILPFITLAASIYVFEADVNKESVLYLLLIWGGYRFNLKLITILTLIIATVSMYYTGHKMGGYVFGGWDNNFFLLQLFLFVNMVSILFFKAILMEKEDEENKLKISEQVLSTERNILKATIESTNTTSIFSLDTNLNYLNFNSPHEKFMKNTYGTSIKIGDNHLELISPKNEKENYFSLYQNVLDGNNYEKEEKDSVGSYWKIAKSPIRDDNQNIIGISVIITDISDLKLKKIQLKENNLSLNERIKELGCLYDITKIINRKSLSKTEKLQTCVQIIKDSFQFPENTNCRIQFDEEEFFSDNYKKPNAYISQKIVIKGVERGCIEVGCFDEKKICTEAIFLKEEIKLLETLTDIISKSFQAKIVEENLRKSEESYRTLFENVQDVFFKTSIQTRTILNVSPSCTQFNDITREELIGQNMFSIYSDENDAHLILDKLIKEKKIIDYTSKITIKDKDFHISINAEFTYDEHNEPEFIIGSIRDISNRRLAEENLKISEEKFRSIYENMQDVYYMHTMDGKLLDVSPSVEKYFLDKKENLIGIHIPNIYTKPELYFELITKIVKEDSIYDEEIEFITPTGETLVFSVTSRLIKDSDGNPSMIEGTMRNINERIINQKQMLEATEKIKESEEKFRSIYESFADIYFKKTIDGLLLDVSPSAEKYFNMKRETIIGMNAYDFYVERAEADLLYESLLLNKQIHDYEARFLTANKEIIYFSVSAKVVLDSSGKPAYFEGTMRDINERIQNREKLLEGADKIKKSEEKFRSIFENMQDIYYQHDFDGKITEMSPSCEKHFKRKREEMIGLYTKELYYDPSKQKELREKITKEGSLNDEQVEFITATGEPVHFSINCKIIYNQNGVPSYVEGSLRNINERIHNQKQLLDASEKIMKSEAKFRSIFENTQDIYYMQNLDGVIYEISPSVEKHLKYKREQVIGRDSKHLHYDLSRQNELREKIIKEGGLDDEYAQFVTATGEPIFFSINCKVIHDQDGKPSHVEGSIRNINEKILNQQQLLEANEKIKESEKKYRNIFENAKDVFFMGSIKEDRLIDISPSCSYFGVQPEDIIGKPIEEFYFDPKDRKEVVETRNKFGEIKDYIVKFVFNDKPFYISLNSKITYDVNNEPEFLIGSFTDVTDRIQAEKNLKISESKFRSIYENFEDVYFKTKLDGTFEELSPSFEKHFLKTSSEAIGNSVLDIYYNKKDRDLLLEKLEKDNHVSDFDAQFIDAKGVVQFFSMNAHFLYEDGVPAYIEGTLRNVNDRVAVQKEMISKNRKLEFQNTELEQFAYIASHDLQEPLITVIHSIQMLEEELGEKLDEDQKQYLEFINSSTSRMQVLVKGLLDYSRIGKERKSNKIDCNKIVSLVLADMATSLNESKAIVEFENLPIIESNTTEMRQLFQNLISNANKFRKKDVQPKIKIAAVKEGKNWLFSIQDNGIGIEEHNIEKVFVIFKRLHNRNEYQGTGIGLSHCKKIIEQHRGKIWVESKYNEGSTFKWTLPIEQNL